MALHFSSHWFSFSPLVCDCTTHLTIMSVTIPEFIWLHNVPCTIYHSDQVSYCINSSPQLYLSFKKPSLDVDLNICGSLLVTLYHLVSPSMITMNHSYSQCNLYPTDSCTGPKGDAAPVLAGLYYNHWLSAPHYIAWSIVSVQASVSCRFFWYQNYFSG